MSLQFATNTNIPANIEQSIRFIFGFSVQQRDAFPLEGEAPRQIF
jgi:hypothetical protein